MHYHASLSYFRFANVNYIQFQSVVNFQGDRSQLVFVALPTDPPVCYDLSGLTKIAHAY